MAARRKAARRRRSPWLPVLATLAGVAVVLLAFLAIRWATTPAPAPPPAPASADQVAGALASVSPAELDQVGAGSATPGVRLVSASPLVGAGGRPQVLYIGAEFCPYCAAERWPLIVALSRFGTFSGLQTTTSAANDVYPNTPTFSFRGATYSSQYVDFVAVEEFSNQPAAGGGYRPLQSLTPAQQALVQQYGGGIPFVDFGNRAVLAGATYSPQLIQGMSWDQIVHSLGEPRSDQAKAILGSANVLTASICRATGQQPASVCATPGVQAAASQLR